MSMIIGKKLLIIANAKKMFIYLFFIYLDPSILLTYLQ